MFFFFVQFYDFQFTPNLTLATFFWVTPEQLFVLILFTVRHYSLQVSKLGYMQIWSHSTSYTPPCVFQCPPRPVCTYRPSCDRANINVPAIFHARFLWPLLLFREAPGAVMASHMRAAACICLPLWCVH